MARADLSESKIRQTLGHKDREGTMRYTKLKVHDLRDALARISRSHKFEQKSTVLLLQNVADLLQNGAINEEDLQKVLLNLSKNK